MTIKNQISLFLSKEYLQKVMFDKNTANHLRLEFNMKTLSSHCHNSTKP